MSHGRRLGDKSGRELGASRDERAWLSKTTWSGERTPSTRQAGCTTGSFARFALERGLERRDRSSATATMHTRYA